MTIDNKNIGRLFILLAICSLLLGLIFGVIGGLQYILPPFLKEQLAFQKTRPLHVYLIVSWIFSTAVGCIYYFLPAVTGRKLYSAPLALAHFTIQVIILLIVITGFYAGRFSGREYLEFPAWVSFLILFNWILFMINFFASVPFKFNSAPAYVWMWATGIVFYFITMAEAQLWLLPYFNNNIVRDLTIQWKALGSMVGAWNMLIYGTSMYVMESITKDKTLGRSKTAYFFYFLSLTNLMFNWGHHTYIVPSSPLVKEVSYIISMTELLFIGKIIYTWRQSYLAAKLNYHYLPFRILSTGDLWVLLNLILSIAISVPAINRYTHGTHITVAHAMGATIGINTMLLLGSLFFIADKIAPEILKKRKNYFSFSMRLLNVSLMVFWMSLLVSGLIKSIDMQRKDAFAVIMQNLQPYFKIFTFSGILVLLGLFLILVPLLNLFSVNMDSEKMEHIQVPRLMQESEQN